MTPLTPAQTRSVLQYLGLEASRPDQAFLTALLNAYVRTVPWESASRIVRRAQTPETGHCPRWPEEFWEGALTRGLGGTCFESNYAFFALLQSLGFEGYLTINDMNEFVGCHTAAIVELDGAQWMADAGFPVHVPVQLHPSHQTQGQSAWMTYTARPLPDSAFVIERSPHPMLYCFTVRNTPVSEADYRAATVRDYGPDGLFLREVVINKVLEGRLWRFSNREPQPCLQEFVDGRRIDHLIANGDDNLDEMARVVAAKFSIDESTVREALRLTA